MKRAAGLPSASFGAARDAPASGRAGTPADIHANVRADDPAGVSASPSVREEIGRLEHVLTPTECKVAAAVLSDYPFSGLDTIEMMAGRVGASAPTITRFVRKLGFAGYQQFQRRLIEELRDGERSPLDLHESPDRLAAGGFGEFVRSSLACLGRLPATLGEAQLQRTCAELADPRHAVHVIGGRVSDSVAQYLSRHLMQIRPGVSHLPPDPEIWPSHLLALRPRDVVLIVDFRRYQPNLAELAARVAARKGRVILVTDRWLSPVAGNAAEVLVVPIDNGSAWDTCAGAILLMEYLIDRIADRDWPATRARLENWEALRPRRAAKFARGHANRSADDRASEGDEEEEGRG